MLWFNIYKTGLFITNAVWSFSKPLFWKMWKPLSLNMHLTFYVDIVIKRWYSDRVFFYLIYCHLIHLWYRFAWLSIVGCLMSSGNIDVYWIHIQGENKFNNASKKNYTEIIEGLKHQDNIINSCSRVGYGRKIVFCSVYKSHALLRSITKRFLWCRGLSIMVNGQAWRIITWQPTSTGHPYMYC